MSTLLSQPSADFRPLAITSAWFLAPDDSLSLAFTSSAWSRAAFSAFLVASTFFSAAVALVLLALASLTVAALFFLMSIASQLILAQAASAAFSLGPRP